MRNYITNKILSLLLPIQIIFISIVSKNPEWIEKNYSEGVYPLLSRLLRRFIGWIPISVGDILYGILILIVLRWLWLLFETRLAPFREHLYTFLSFLSVVFFIFNLFWGLNYYRVPLYEKLGIKELTYSQEQLEKTTELHIQRLNKIHHQIVANDSLALVIPYKRRAIYKIAGNQYKNFYLDSLDFHFNSRSIKSSLFSTPLSYMGFAGYLNPFTGESQVNRKIPLSNYPATTCHEMAHQLGYASESEANYIGYLACINNDDNYFQYSGELLAVNHLLYAIAKNDRNLYKTYKKKLHIGIQKDMQITHDFWDSYQNPLEPYFKKFYDAYLKANKQKDGIQSYNAMVGYLIHKPL